MKRHATAARRVRLTLVLLMTAICSATCAPGSSDDSGLQNEMPQRSIDDVLGDYTPRWMSIPGVVGTGIGKCDDQPCIRVMVVKKTPELVDKIPSKVEGYIVDIVETGAFRARPPR